MIELTTSDGFGFPAGVTKLTCPCGRQMSYLGCTILPTETKGNQMLDNLEASIDATNYNPNLLVTYKSIKNGEVTYPTLKVNELEYELDSYRRLQDQLTISNNQISQILDNLSADGWYNPNTDKEEILRDLCEILGHEPKQSVTITATVNVEVTYDIPLEDVEDFDARYFLQDNLSIDSYNGDVCIESFDVEDADVNY
jgi:hypothetical protein